MNIRAYIGVESGTHDVPEPVRVIGNPSGPDIIACIPGLVEMWAWLLMPGMSGISAMSDIPGAAAGGVLVARAESGAGE
ncbi:MAG: hypothetical protein M3154_00310 [Candidatus Eremiobacteraeota bacterium]|nr:hypothetical protein [Candidatus Eremiobacteraeota bacterium]